MNRLPQRVEELDDEEKKIFFPRSFPAEADSRTIPALEPPPLRILTFLENITLFAGSLGINKSGGKL